MVLENSVEAGGHDDSRRDERGGAGGCNCVSLTPQVELRPHMGEASST